MTSPPGGALGERAALSRPRVGHRELQTHLAVHGIDLAKQPFRLGPWLQLDATGDGISAVASAAEHTLERARFLLRETQRPPYVIPEQV